MSDNERGNERGNGHDNDGFERFERQRLRGSATGPAITITRTGVITFTPAAFALLGSPAYVEFGYARATNKIGIRAADPKNDRSAYKLRPTRAGSDTWVVGARAFLDEYHIDRERARVLSAELQGQWLTALAPKAGSDPVGAKVVSRRGRAAGGKSGVASEASAEASDGGEAEASDEG